MKEEKKRKEKALSYPQIKKQVEAKDELADRYFQSIQNILGRSKSKW